MGPVATRQGEESGSGAQEADKRLHLQHFATDFLYDDTTFQRRYRVSHNLTMSLTRAEIEATGSEGRLPGLIDMYCVYIFSQNAFPFYSAPTMESSDIRSHARVRMASSSALKLNPRPFAAILSTHVRMVHALTANAEYQ